MKGEGARGKEGSGISGILVSTLRGYKGGAWADGLVESEGRAFAGDSEDEGEGDGFFGGESTSGRSNSSSSSLTRMIGSVVF